MPFRPEHTLLKVDVDKMHTIDTRSVENLFGMWSVFSKSSEAVEDGKRLENLSWRLWNRETFCCAPEHQARSTLTPVDSFTKRPKVVGFEVPELSSSIDSTISASNQSDNALGLDGTSENITRPEIRRHDSSESRSRGREKHITPIDLEKIVVSIKEKKELRSLSPLSMPSQVERSPKPQTLNEPSHVDAPSQEKAPATKLDNMTVRALSPRTFLTESSTSTIATDHSDTSPAARSDESTSTEMSGHSIVRGFAPGGAPSTYRSHTQLAPQPTPILKTSIHHRPDPSKKKGPIFTLGGGSSTEEENSFPDSGASKVEDRFAKRVSNGKKHPSFKYEIENIRSSVVENENPFESDSEDDEEDISESAIDDDEENDEGWEDEDSEEESSESDDKTLFQRIDSRPNLVSRKSLLSLMLHEPDRAKALQNAASRSMPAMRRSRTSSPNGPSMASSPQEGLALDIPRSKPIVVTTPNTYQPASSPRTTRRNMLSAELTESLRKHLLWERQQRNVTSYAALKRRHTSHDVKDLTHYPGERPEATMASKEASKNNSWNHYFDHGLLDYHQSGW